MWGRGNNSLFNLGVLCAVDEKMHQNRAIAKYLLVFRDDARQGLWKEQVKCHCGGEEGAVPAQALGSEILGFEFFVLFLPHLFNLLRPHVHLKTRAA